MREVRDYCIVSYRYREKSISISMELEQHIDKQSFLRVGLIGDPVAHSYSPRFQQAAFDACGIPARYELWQTSESELPARVASLLVPQSLAPIVTFLSNDAFCLFLDVFVLFATC